MCTKSVHNYVLNIHLCVTKQRLKGIFSGLGLIGKDQTFSLLLENENGTKERFRDQFVAPPPLPLDALLYLRYPPYSTQRDY